MGQLYSPGGVLIFGRVMTRPKIDYTKTGTVFVKFTVLFDKSENSSGEFISCYIFAEDLVPYGKRLYRGQRIMVAGKLGQFEYTAKRGADKGKRYLGRNMVVHFLMGMVPLEQFGITPAADPNVERPPTEWEVNQHPDVYF